MRTTEEIRRRRDLDLWAFWPDGTMCRLKEVGEYLTWMSDDYQTVSVMEYDEDGSPKRWAIEP